MTDAEKLVAMEALLVKAGDLVALFIQTGDYPIGAGKVLREIRAILAPPPDPDALAHDITVLWHRAAFPSSTESTGRMMFLGLAARQHELVPARHLPEKAHVERKGTRRQKRLARRLGKRWCLGFGED